MTLPLLLSVPHAGMNVPPQVAEKFLLTPEQIRVDGDEGAAEIYSLKEHVAQFISADVPRTVIDLNRAEDDRRADGVFKTETIFREAVWSEPLNEHEEAWLLQNVYHEYHAQLSAASERRELKLAIDCHTMCAVAPPSYLNAGEPRPMVCLGDLRGRSLPQAWMPRLLRVFQQQFREFEVTQNVPFSGGHITRSHYTEMPWLQLELSRGEEINIDEKRTRVLSALEAFCREMDWA